MIETSELMTALSPLLPALEADGVALEVRRADDREVVFELVRSAQACEDCVMPRDALERIIADCLVGAGIRTARVSVLGVT
ncbi:MAG: hypothetical protein AB7G13_23695 [Lautropia sp.]